VRKVEKRHSAYLIPKLLLFRRTVAAVVGPKLAPSVVTLGFILVWYALNIGFNLLNKSIFKYYPYPWTVSG
jgi:solute carrier family 35 protein E1